MSGQELATLYYSLVPTTRGINGQLESELVKPTGAAGVRSGQQFGKGMQSGSKSGLLSMKNAVTGLGVLAGAAALKSASAYTTTAKEVAKLQRTLGGSVEDASRWRFAAQQAGLSADDFARSIGLLSKNIAAGKVDKLGIQTRDAAGNLKPLGDLLPVIADKFKGMENGAQKNALAMQLFGRSGLALLPFLNRGSAGLGELRKKADELGVTLNEKSLEAMRKNVAQTREFKASLEGLEVKLGQGVIPILTEAAKVGEGVAKVFSAQGKGAVQLETGALIAGAAYVKLAKPILGATKNLYGNIAAKRASQLASTDLAVAEAAAGTAEDAAAAAVTNLTAARGRLAAITATVEGETGVLAGTEISAAGSAKALSAAEADVVKAEAAVVTTSTAASGATTDLAAAQQTATTTSIGLKGGLLVVVAGFAAYKATAYGLDKLVDFKANGADAEALGVALDTLGSRGIVAGELAKKYGSDFSELASDIKFAAKDSGKYRFFHPNQIANIKAAQQNIGKLDDQLAERVRSGDLKGAERAYLSISTALHNQGVSATEVQRSFHGYWSALDTATQKTLNQKAATDKAAAAAAAAKGKLGALGDTAVSAAERGSKAWKDYQTILGRTEPVDQAQSAFRKVFTGGDDVKKAKSNVDAAFGALKESFKKNGKTFDLNTEAGRENQQAADDAKTAILDYEQALQESGQLSGGQIKSVFEGLIGQLDDTAAGAGFTKDEIDVMNQALSLTPDKVEIAFDTPGYDTTIKHFRDVNDAFMASLLLAVAAERYRAGLATPPPDPNRTGVGPGTDGLPGYVPDKPGRTGVGPGRDGKPGYIPGQSTYRPPDYHPGANLKAQDQPAKFSDQIPTIKNVTVSPDITVAPSFKSDITVTPKVAAPVIKNGDLHASPVTVNVPEPKVTLGAFKPNISVPGQKQASPFFPKSQPVAKQPTTGDILRGISKTIRDHPESREFFALAKQRPDLRGFFQQVSDEASAIQRPKPQRFGSDGVHFPPPVHPQIHVQIPPPPRATLPEQPKKSRRQVGSVTNNWNITGENADGVARKVDKKQRRYIPVGTSA